MNSHILSKRDWYIPDPRSIAVGNIVPLVNSKHPVCSNGRIAHILISPKHTWVKVEVLSASTTNVVDTWYFDGSTLKRVL